MSLRQKIEIVEKQKWSSVRLGKLKFKLSSFFECVIIFLNMAKKKMTIEDLAVMTKNAFDRIDRRFDKMDERFDKVEARLDRIENLLIRGLENRMDRVEDKVRVVETKLKI